MIPPSDDEIREELEHHLAARAEHNRNAGLPPVEASRQARLRFGNFTNIFENTRAIHRSQWLDDLSLDLTQSLRSFRRSPLVPLAALLLLTLGIGSSTAVFTVIDRILFRPLPFANPEQLVSFGLTAPLDKHEFMLHTDFYSWQSTHTASSPFTAMASTRGAVDCDLTDGAPQRLRCGAVDIGMIPLLGVPLYRGANFTPAQDLPNGPRAAILGYSLWRSRFGSREDIVGAAIQLDGQPATIMGILPPNYVVPTLGSIDMLIPQQASRAPAPKGPWLFLRAFARLAPNTNLTQATAALAPNLASAINLVPAPFRKEVRLKVQSLQDRQTSDVRTMSWLLFAAVLSVFLIACANLANLWIARNATRQQETAIRLSLGASRFRLLRHLLTETLAISVLGAISGLLLASLLLRIALLLAPTGLFTPQDLVIDARIIAFAFTMATLAATSSTFFSSFQIHPAPHLNNRHGHFSTPRLRLALVTLQIAISLVLCTSAALLIRSLWTIETVSLGFDTANTLFAHVDLGRNGFTTPAARSTFFNQLEISLSALPGVTAVSVADSLPPSGRQASMIYSNIEIEGRPRPREGTGGMVSYRIVTPNFFTVLGIPILQGQGFTTLHRQSGDPVVIINRILAHRLFGQSSPLGQRLRFGGEGDWHTIIGVCDNIQNAGLAPRDGEYYLPRTFTTDPRRAYFLLRTTLAAPAVDPWFQQALHRLNPNLPAQLLPFTSRVSDIAATPRFETILLSLFATTGLCLALLGLYGVISFLVTQRTREMGIRLALGASHTSVTMLFLRQAFLWSITGISLGLALSWLSTSYLRARLYEVSPRDPLTWILASAGLLFTALLAAYLPARRAAQVAPSEALRG